MSRSNGRTSPLKTKTPEENFRRRFSATQFLEPELDAQTAQSVILGVIRPDKTRVREEGRVIDEAPLNAGARVPGPLDDWIKLTSATAKDVRGHTRITNRETANEVTADIIDEMPPASAFGV